MLIKQSIIFFRDRTVLNRTCEIKMTNKTLKRSKKPKLLGTVNSRYLDFGYLE